MEHLLGLVSECHYINSRYKSFVDTLHCVLENGSDLHVNERQKIRHYCARSTEERIRIRRRITRKKKKNAKSLFFTSCGAYVNCAIILCYTYTHSFGNQP